MILEEEDLLITKAKMLYGMDSSRRGQLAGKGMKELKERLKEEPEFGIPLQSPMMTTIARGARLKKVYLRSADSGGGKTRTALADICNISIPYFYDTDKKEWIYTGCEEPSLFISTELEEDEVQTIIMAYVSGVPENKILDGDYEGDEEERVDKAIEYIATYPLYIEIINDFGIEDISNIIKTYKREKGCHYFVFDGYWINRAKAIANDIGLPEYKTYEELYKALEDEGTVRSIMENDKEIEFKFHARKLEYIASFLKPATAGSDISPFSTKNLPKCDYPIPEEDLAKYNAILDSMDNKDYLLVSRVTDAFLTNKLQKSKQYRTIDLKKDMKKKCLKTKEYIHSLGEWDKYIEYLKKEICK